MLRATKIVATLGPIIRRYALERNKGEHFGDFVHRMGYVKQTGTPFDFHDKPQPKRNSGALRTLRQAPLSRGAFFAPSGQKEGRPPTPKRSAHCFLTYPNSPPLSGGENLTVCYESTASGFTSPATPSCRPHRGFRTGGKLAQEPSMRPLSLAMSTTEILAQLPTLTPVDRERVRAHLDALDAAAPLSREEKQLIHERVAAHRQNPDSAVTWARRGLISQNPRLWYRKRSVRAAEDFLLAVSVALARIEAHPAAHVIVDPATGPGECYSSLAGRPGVASKAGVTNYAEASVHLPLHTCADHRQHYPVRSVAGVQFQKPLSAAA
eukprot:gene32899-44004_t